MLNVAINMASHVSHMQRCEKMQSVDMVTFYFTKFFNFFSQGGEVHRQSTYYFYIIRMEHMQLKILFFKVHLTHMQIISQVLVVIWVLSSFFFLICTLLALGTQAHPLNSIKVIQRLIYAYNNYDYEHPRKISVQCLN